MVSVNGNSERRRWLKTLIAQLPSLSAITDLSAYDLRLPLPPALAFGSLLSLLAATAGSVL